MDDFQKLVPLYRRTTVLSYPLTLYSLNSPPHPSPLNSAVPAAPLVVMAPPREDACPIQKLASTQNMKQ